MVIDKKTTTNVHWQARMKLKKDLNKIFFVLKYVFLPKKEAVISFAEFNQTREDTLSLYLTLISQTWSKSRLTETKLVNPLLSQRTKLIWSTEVFETHLPGLPSVARPPHYFHGLLWFWLRPGFQTPGEKSARATLIITHLPGLTLTESAHKSSDSQNFRPQFSIRILFYSTFALYVLKRKLATSFMKKYFSLSFTRKPFVIWECK